MTELVWEGKYKDGKKVGPVRIALPFQAVETVNETAQQRQLTLDMYTAGRETDWRNRLIWGDKKYVLPSLLPEFAGKVDLIYIDPPFLQQLFPRCAYLKPRTGQEDAHSSADIALRYEVVVPCAYCRNIGRVTQVRLGVKRKPTAQHRAVTGFGGEWQNQGILLQTADPDGVQALVEYAKGGEKPAHSDSKVRVGDVVHLCIVEIFAHWAAVRPATGRALKRSLKFRSRFHQPMITQR